MDENSNIPSASGAEPQQPAPEPAPSAVPENPFAAFGAPVPALSLRPRRPPMLCSRRLPQPLRLLK